VSPQYASRSGRAASFILVAATRPICGVMSERNASVRRLAGSTKRNIFRLWMPFVRLDSDRSNSSSGGRTLSYPCLPRTSKQARMAVVIRAADSGKRSSRPSGSKSEDWVIEASIIPTVGWDQCQLRPDCADSGPGSSPGRLQTQKAKAFAMFTPSTFSASATTSGLIASSRLSSSTASPPPSRRPRLKVPMLMP